MNWSLFLVILGAVLLPGPDFLAVVKNSLMYSRRAGIATAFGIVAGNVVWVVASILGISLILAKLAIVFTALKVIGVVYLAYLGIKMLKSPRSDFDATVSKGRSEIPLRKAFMQGFIVNVTNVKCALFFVAFFTVMLSADTTMYERWGYGLEIMLIALVCFTTIAIFFNFSPIRSLYEKFGYVAEKIFGGFLLFFSYRVAKTVAD